MEKVASFWRPFRLLGDGQHRGQIASQLDPELRSLAAMARVTRRRLRHQDDRINQSAERVRGLQATVLAMKGTGELFDLRAVEVGHARVEQRRRFVGGFDMVLKFVASRREPQHLFLPLAGRHNIVEHQVQQLLAPRFDLAQLAFRAGEAARCSLRRRGARSAAPLRSVLQRDTEPPGAIIAPSLNAGEGRHRAMLNMVNAAGLAEDQCLRCGLDPRTAPLADRRRRGRLGAGRPADARARADESAADHHRR
jgi:hypothetical protein